MCRFIESIRIQDGQIMHLNDHQDRMDRTTLHFFKSKIFPRLEHYLEVPQSCQEGTFKCRIVYDQNILDIAWIPYHIRTINSIALATLPDLDYNWKYEDRSQFKSAIGYAQTDDIIIVRDEYLTDSSYANIIFKQGKNWLTPDTPLLDGTQRQRLISSGLIVPCPIRISELKMFDGLKYINAMLSMDLSPELPIDVIRLP